MARLDTPFQPGHFNKPLSDAYYKLEHARNFVNEASQDVNCSFCRSHLIEIAKGIEYAMKIQRFNDENTAEQMAEYRATLQNNSILWILSSVSGLVTKLKMFRAKLFIILHMNK